MMDTKIEQALKHMIDGTASTGEIELLRQKLAGGQVSISGDFNRSAVILGDGNIVVQLTTEMADVLTRWKLADSSPPRDHRLEGIHLLPFDYDQRIQNFLTEYLGNYNKSVPFGGRNKALAVLDEWISGTIPYLLLAAPAGRGKSALLVRWLDTLQGRGDLALVFIPVSIRFGTNMERVFYGSLAARLAYLYGDDVPASPETSTAVYRGLVSDYLSKPLMDGRTLLVVLDGLDEAADWEAGANFLAAEPPTRVRVVVSARGEAIQWFARLNWDSHLATTLPLSSLDRAGVADVLVKMAHPLDQLGHNVDIVGELYRLSEGDPLLVGLYVGDIWTKGEKVTQLQPGDLASIKPGYIGYFERWWEDQKKLWDKEKPWLEKHVRVVRSLLAGAFGSLTKNDFQALDSELEADYIADALDILQRLIIRNNQGQGYTFSHPKLGQYFWEALTLAEQAQIEGRFLIWGEATLQEFVDGKRNSKRKVEVSIYVIQNYAAHLARAKQPIEKWLPLTHHHEWAQAWFAVEGAYGGYLQDVIRVWERCKALDRQVTEENGNAFHLGVQVRCGLIEASLHSLAGMIPFKLIPALVQTGLWTLAQAWVVIRQTPGDWQKSEAIISILPCLEDQNLTEALAMAREIGDEGFRANVLSVLAQRLPEVSREALSVARNIRAEDDRARVLSELAERLPAVADEVLTATREIRDEGSRARILSALVQHLPEVSDEALTAVRKIRSEGDRSHVLSALVWHVPGQKLDQVLAVTRQIRDEVPRARVLNALAQRMPSVTEETLAVAREIRDEGSRAYMLSVLAQHLPPSAAELRQVLAAAREITDKGSRAHVLSALAQHLPDVVDEALATVREIKDGWSRTYILSVLAQHIPEVLEEALSTAREIRNEEDRARVLSALVQRLPEEELGRVLAVVREIRDEWSRAYMLSELTQRLPNLVEEALAAAWKIGDERFCDRALSALGQQLPETTYEVLIADQEIRDIEDHVRLLNALAQHISPSSVELRQALEAVQGIKDQDSRVRMLNELVQSLMRISKKECYLSIEITVSQLALHTRNNFFSDLSDLMPLLLHLGVTGLDEEILQAIHDVRAWWP